MKKVTWVIILVLMLSSLTGCNTTQKELINELMSLTDGAFYEVNCSGKITYEPPKDWGSSAEESTPQTIDFDLKAYVDLESEVARFTLVYKHNDLNKSRRMEGYIKDRKLIASKDHFLLDYPRTRYDKVNSEYIGIDLPYSMRSLLGDIKSGKNIAHKLLDVLAEEVVEFPVSKQGDSYLLSLDSQEASKVGVSFMKTTINKAGEVYDILTEYLANVEDLSDLLKEKATFVKKIQDYFRDGDLFGISAHFLNGALYGSHCEAKATFENDTVKLDLKGNLDYMLEENKVFEIKLTVAKVEKQAFKLPRSLKILSATEEEYYSSNGLYYFFDMENEYSQMYDLKLKNGIEYFNINELGYSLENTNKEGIYYLIPESDYSLMHLMYGIESGKIKAEIEKEGMPKVSCVPLEVDGIFYVSRQELEKLGFELLKDEHNDLFIYYNIPLTYFTEAYDKISYDTY